MFLKTIKYLSKKLVPSYFFKMVLTLGILFGLESSTLLASDLYIVEGPFSSMEKSVLKVDLLGGEDKKINLSGVPLGMTRIDRKNYVLTGLPSKGFLEEIDNDKVVKTMELKSEAYQVGCLMSKLYFIQKGPLTQSRLAGNPSILNEITTEEMNKGGEITRTIFNEPFRVDFFQSFKDKFYFATDNYTIFSVDPELLTLNTLYKHQKRLCSMLLNNHDENIYLGYVNESKLGVLKIDGSDLQEIVLRGYPFPKSLTSFRDLVFVTCAKVPSYRSVHADIINVIKGKNVIKTIMHSGDLGTPVIFRNSLYTLIDKTICKINYDSYTNIFEIVKTFDMELGRKPCLLVVGNDENPFFGNLVLKKGKKFLDINFHYVKK